MDLVKEDLEKGIFTEDIVYQVYGVVAEEQGAGWIVDEEKTEGRREEIREERKEESVPFEEFWKEERENNGKRF